MKTIVTIIAVFFFTHLAAQPPSKIGHPDSVDIQKGTQLLCSIYLYSTLEKNKTAKHLQRYLCTALDVPYTRNRKQRELLLSQKLQAIVGRKL